MIKGDEPIENLNEDELGHSQLAEAIAGEIREVNSGEGIVFGILGPWGSGKTSLINLICIELAKPPAYAILDFNPWIFSGTDDLVRSFFAELAEQLRLESDKLESIADELERYADVIAPLQVLPVVGAWIERASSAGQALKKLRGRGQGGVNAVRKKVEEKLRDLERPIVVVIDDLDRLHTNEIREMFKLVRLTAHFPNLIYVVAFDRFRVEKALEDNGLSGRDYLEKIIQIPYDIPVVPVGLLTQQITNAIDQALDGLRYADDFDAQRWPDVFFDVIRPLFKSMRDVRRYAASTRATVRSIGGHVEMVDVLALEAVRIFLPDLFAAIADARQVLTTTSNALTSRGNNDVSESLIEALLQSADQKADIARAMINRLFPAAAGYVGGTPYGSEWLKQWQRERRVAHPDVLSFYLERVAGQGLEAFWTAKTAIPLLTDGQKLEAFFRSLNPSAWEDLISALETFEEDFPIEAAEPASVVLLNLLPEIPERPRGIFDLDSRLVVERVVLRFFRRLPGPEEAEATVRSALPQITTLFGKLTLLRLVGHEENVGDDLISQNSSMELQSSFRDEVRAASPQALATEPRLVNLLYWTKKTAETSESQLELTIDAILGGALLKAALGEERSQISGTRNVRVEKTLNWEALIDLVGNEESIRRIVEECRDLCDDDALNEAIELAEKYLAVEGPSRGSRLN